jgi:pimeloyl-ACP methyl ester carboxylesterase
MHNLQITEDDKRSSAIKKTHHHLIFALRVILLLFFISGFFFSCLPLGRAMIRSALVLPALLSVSQPALLIASGDPIQHTQTTISSPSGTVNLDIYQPTAQSPLINSARSGILIIPGVGDNRRDPQLINLAETMARAGLVVMDMLTPALKNYILSAQDSDATVLAFEALNHLPAMQHSKSGIIAFSGGVPLASFAAADARIRTQVAFVAFFGGYFNTTDLIRAFGRRAMDIDGKQEAWHPNIVPIQTIANTITQTFTANEQYLITNAIDTNTLLLPDEINALSPAAQAVYHLLMGDEPERADANIAALPPSIHALLYELSPERVIQQIRAPIYLLHDRNDTLVPVTESRDFAAALAKLHHPYDYVEFHIFDHVEVRANSNLGQIITDGSHLFSILDNILLASS